MPEHHNGSFSSGVQLIWDSTSIGNAEKCPRYYYYTMIKGVAPTYISVHLLFGGLYAKALENFYKYRALGADIESATLRVVKEAMLASWDQEKNAPVEFNDPKGLKTRPNLIRTIVWYLEEFADESNSGIKTHHLSSGKPAVELSFKLPIAPDVVLSGHLDKAVSMGTSLFVMDQKTTGGTIGPYFFDGFNPNTQMSCYTLAGQIILESPVRGVIIDAAQIAVGFSRFERGFTYRTKDQLEEWWTSAYDTIRRHQDYTLDSETSGERAFPMNTASCGNYGGCAFRGVCSTSPRLRERMLKTYFQPHIWDPSEDR